MAELCAAILAKGISGQLKRGLGREYIEQTEPLSTVRGRIDISESIRTQSIHKQQLVCSYDEFSVDSYLNRILKATMELQRCDMQFLCAPLELQKVFLGAHEAYVK